ncbi:MAG: Hsp20/alpha crystallin family protein [Anaerolineae bacterium]
MNRHENRDIGWQQEMNRLARQTLRPTDRQGARVFPSIIVSATEKTLVIRAEIPGMDPIDFDINTTGDMLTLQGTRATNRKLEGGWYHRRERKAGDFGRAVRLPVEVDGDRAEATYVAGVLTISLPLKETGKPKEIPVKVVEG